MIDFKLQLRPDQTIAILYPPFDVQTEAIRADERWANVVLIFVRSPAQLADRVQIAINALDRGAAAWIAFPTTRQLGTDMNRDILQRLLAEQGSCSSRRVTLTEAWAAIRLDKLE